MILSTAYIYIHTCINVVKEKITHGMIGINFKTVVILEKGRKMAE